MEAVSAAQSVCCRLALKQPHRMRFARTAQVSLSPEGGAHLDAEIVFEDVTLPAEGMLVIDIFGGGSTATSDLIGKVMVPLLRLPWAAPARFPLITGEIEVKAVLRQDDILATGEALAAASLPRPAVAPISAVTVAASTDINSRLARAKTAPPASPAKPPPAAPPTPAAPPPAPPKGSPTPAPPLPTPAEPAPTPAPRESSHAEDLSPEEAASFELRGQRARPRKKIEYAPVRNTTYLKPPGSCNTKWKTDTRSIDFQAECVEDSRIYVLDACSQTSIAECKHCRIVIAPVSGSVFLIELEATLRLISSCVKAGRVG